jgi:hypothetical protein
MYNCLAFDAARARAVCLDSWAGVTWEYNGIDWRLVPTASHPPPSSYSSGLAYDSARGRVVWDGYNGTWEYDGWNWTQVLPETRRRTAVVYDVARGCLVSDQQTWEYWPAAAPSWTRHGLGCAGSAGVPSLDSGSQTPALGTTLQLQLSTLPAQADLVYVAFGVGIASWNGTALPTDLTGFGMTGCKLWIDPTTGLVLIHAGSSTTYPLRIPNDPALSGRTVATQALVFDPAATNGIGSVSNAGVMRLF